MKQIWHGHSTFRMGEGESKILIDAFLFDNPSRDNGRGGCPRGENSRQGGDE
jgi:L-ascorbate metabolism protein UlaG (beta-lactamase superfamily)